jgi:hypothetical protein
LKKLWILERFYSTKYPLHHDGRKGVKLFLKGTMASALDIVKAVQDKTLPASFKANLTDDLRQACYSGNFEECYSIVHDRSCDVNDRAVVGGALSWRPGATPLHIACSKGHSAVISLLLEFRADTTIKDKAAEIPLHVACRSGGAAP